MSKHAPTEPARDFTGLGAGMTKSQPVLFFVAMVLLCDGFSNPDTAKRPGRNLPKDGKLRIGVVRRVEVSKG